ncbi:MAG: 50S ribosomal protein L2, partial [Proteobacteria bacterium]|nr:50S ribosomal protein L2 [Pseudomonadota bacterium]
MAVIKAKPTSPGRRGVIAVKADLYKGKPLKSLTRVKSKNGVIDFKRNKFDIPAVVERIEYDPNRSAHIALLLYKDGERRYIIAPSKLKVGDEVISADNCEIKVGNSM